MIAADTSFIYALLDQRDDRHIQAATWYEDVDEEMATTPMVLAEVDHLARTRAGERAVTAFRDDVRSGAYLIEWWPTAAQEASRIAGRYLDAGVSMTDATLVALAARVTTLQIATFDERHFRVLRPLQRGAGAFQLLPLDAGYY